MAQSSKLLRRALFALVASTLVATTVRSGVDVGFDEKVDFGAFKSYAWKEGGWQAMKSMTEANIHRAVEQELQAKGLKKFEADADLWVITYASGSSEQSVDALSFGYVPNTWTAWFTASTTSRTTTRGRLVVDLISAKSGNLVWRGIADENLGLDPNTESTGKKVFKVVKKMFKEFPPPAGK